MQAVLVACDLSRSNLKLVSSKLISQVTERLREKKISVRKRTLQKLIEVYQDYCKKCSEGSMTAIDHFEEIPCKIMMLCFDKDCKEFRLPNVELILADDLFPEYLSFEERTMHWIHIFALFSPLHEKALNVILTQKRRLRGEMKNYLALRKKLKEICSEDLHKKTESIFKKIAPFFPDPPKAEEWLRKLNQLKDNNVFNSLEQLLEEQALTTRQIIRDKLLEMIGETSPHFEFLCLLFCKCSFNIFGSEHVLHILDYLSNTTVGNKHLEDSSVKLLLAIVRTFPAIIKDSEKQFQMLLEQRSPVNDKLIEILAMAGPHFSLKLSEIYPFLEGLCMTGTRVQAKYAVSAIAALSSEQSYFSKLYEGLIVSLNSQCNVPTVLQSLGCIAQYSESTFETREEEITSYICQKIIQVEYLDGVYDGISPGHTSQSGDSCQLKIYGLKTLVKRILSDHGSCVKQKINGLLDILLRMLQQRDHFVNFDSSVSDNARIRLAAAKSILRLSRRWDLHITPEIFRITVLVAKDCSTFVRRSFLNKIHRMLKERRLPIRYACAFPLATTDSIEDLQYLNSKYMAEFIKDYSLVARVKQNSDAQGAIFDYPAYIVVYLIHVLAHDTDFPSEGCQDEQMYADLCSPLFSVMQALVNSSIVDGNLDLINDAVLYLYSILRAIRKTEDAVDVQMTAKLHMLADIGIFFLNALKHGAISASLAPGQILLPSSLYGTNFAKNNANSKKFYFSECFLSSVLQKLKSSVPQACTQKPTKNLKYSRKCQDDIPKSNANTFIVTNLASSKLDDLSRGAITHVKTVRPDIPSGRRRKCAVSPTDSGSIGLHECSIIDKQPKIASKQCERTLDKKQISSSGSVSLKSSAADSHVPTQKSKRAAASLMENAVTGFKNSIQPSKRPRRNLKDTFGSKTEDILADLSNTPHLWPCDPGRHSSLGNSKITTGTNGGEATKENAKENRRGQSTGTSESEVVNTNRKAASRSRRKG